MTLVFKSSVARNWYFSTLVSSFDVYECFDIAISEGNAGKTRISKGRTVFRAKHEKNFYKQSFLEADATKALSVSTSLFVACADEFSAFFISFIIFSLASPLMIPCVNLVFNWCIKLLLSLPHILWEKFLPSGDHGLESTSLVNLFAV